MKTVMTTILSIWIFISVSLVAIAADKPYVLKVINKADSVQIDPAAFPPEIKANFVIMNKHCNDCHGQDRIVEALRTGLSRTGVPYGEKNFHEKVMRMSRRQGVSISREEALKLTELFTFLVNKVSVN